MPINVALLLCIPIGFLFYFEARWLLRYTVGHYERKERKVARVLGVFGGLLIPAIYCFGRLGATFPGRVGEMFTIGLWMLFCLAVMELVARILSKPT